MKRLENSEMKSENIFGIALEQLMSAVKNKYSRKDWTALLGISEASISQWINGRTFPASDKLEMIITILKGQELSFEEQKEFDRFLTLLEKPAKDLWHKLPADVYDKTLSEYVLQRDRLALENTISHLYYDLKLELYQDISRQVSIHKECLIKNILKEEPSEDDSFHDISIRNKKLLDAFQEQKNSEYLRLYSCHVSGINSFFNIVLEKILFENFCQFQDKDSIKDCLLDVFEQHYTLLVCPSENYPSHCSGHLNTTSKIHAQEHSPNSEFTSELVKIEPKSKDEVEVTFLLPDRSDKELINISLERIRTEKAEGSWKKAALVYMNCVDNGDDDDVFHALDLSCATAEIRHRENNRKNKKSGRPPDIENYALNFDFGPLVAISGEENKDELQHEIKNELKSIFLRNVKADGASKEVMNKFLLEREYTNHNYSVEILGAVTQSERKLPSLHNGMLCVLFGELELVNASHRLSGSYESQTLISLVDKLREGTGNEKLGNYVTRIENSSDYIIKNNGGDYIALLITDYRI